MTDRTRNPTDELYQATIVDHDRAPRNAGPLADATHQATIDNPLCGDVVTVYARIAGGKIDALQFEGRGCALSRAAASIMTTLVQHRTPEAARALAGEFERFVHAAPDSPVPGDLGELRSFAGVRHFRSRRVCAMLGFRALLRVLDESG